LELQKASGFSVAIPASLVSDTPHLREKTAKLGLVARACSVFGTKEIIVYADDSKRDQRQDLELCLQILNFIETPQYLRKKMFRLSPVLKFTGILPPLQTPHHNVPASIRESRVGDLREGVVITRRGERVQLEVGLERPVETSGSWPVGKRLTVKLTRVGRDLFGEVVEPSKISIYWGYRVRQPKFRLGNLIEEEKFDLTIGTSRYGARLQDVWSKIRDSLRSTGSVLVVFGSPRMGLKEILGQEGKRPEEIFDYYVNTVPQQNVSTIRTEEAILASLGIFNFLKSGFN
jgi:predicted SPOUT superfamily RNA methylase MTH1